MQEVIFKYSGFQREVENGVEKNVVWCPDHFRIEFDFACGVLTPCRSDVELARVSKTVFSVQDEHCLVGRADDGIEIENVPIQAQLFLISPDGFAALNMTRLRAGDQEYFESQTPVSLEVNVRGRAVIECETHARLHLAGCEYSWPRGRHEIEIAPFELPLIETKK